MGRVEKSPNEHPLGPAPGAEMETLALCVEKLAIWFVGIVAPTDSPMLQPPLTPPTYDAG